MEYTHDHYTYSLVWSEKDRGVIASVEEFPKLSAVGSSALDALAELTFIVRVVINDMEDRGEEIPIPKAYLNKHILN
jgi:predicted RNase H-like HicB family nuclease